jgi:two-component system sensor histidine kinase DegS
MPSPSPALELRDVAAEFTNQIEQLRIELREIEVLLRQTGSEIERLTQKELESSARLRQLEANFDAFSREDIKQAYAAAREAALKLLMMRSQLEQFQSKQRYLDRYIQQLRRVSDLSAQAAEQFAAGPRGAPDHPSAADRESVIQTIQAQEAERQRLAQQMHDGPAQSLTNLILQAEIVERLFDNNPTRARAELGALKASAAVTFQRMRDFIFGLRQMMLDDLGLVPTLRRHAQNFEAKNNVTVTLNLNGDRVLPPYVEVTIFRAVQELLNNIAQHANASRVQVTLDLDADPILLVVEDDGSGFDAAEVLARMRARGGSGLVTLEKRVEMLEGHISFQSGTGRGARAEIEIPAA